MNKLNKHNNKAQEEQGSQDSTVEDADFKEVKMTKIKVSLVSNL
ncbi:hypothetical protein ACFDA9_05980 [Staphylococcus epidermidis]